MRAQDDRNAGEPCAGSRTAPAVRYARPYGGSKVGRLRAGRTGGGVSEWPAKEYLRARRDSSRGFHGA